MTDFAPSPNGRTNRAWYDTIRCIWTNPAITPLDIAGSRGVELAAISRTLKLLSARGAVRREGRHYFLTDLGLKIAQGQIDLFAPKVKPVKVNPTHIPDGHTSFVTWVRVDEKLLPIWEKMGPKGRGLVVARIFARLGNPAPLEDAPITHNHRDGCVGASYRLAAPTAAAQWFLSLANAERASLVADFFA